MEKVKCTGWVSSDQTKHTGLYIKDGVIYGKVTRSASLIRNRYQKNKKKSEHDIFYEKYDLNI